MSRRFLCPRWLLLHVLVFVVTASCVLLGFWQLRRLEQRRDYNALLESRLNQPSEALEEVLGRYRADVSAADPESLAYRQVRVSGRYDADEEVLWSRAQSYNGEPGYQVLTPLRLEGGRALLVERGWVPFEPDTATLAEAAPPDTEVVVSGTLRLSQAPPTGFWAGLAPRNPPGELRVTAYADSERLEQQMPYALLPVYLKLEAQEPPQPGLLPVIVPAEPLTEGSHLAYALQWFAFALIAAVGYGLLLYRRAEEAPP